MDLGISEALRTFDRSSGGSLLGKLAGVASQKLTKKTTSPNALVFSKTQANANEGTMAGGKSFAQASAEKNSQKDPGQVVPVDLGSKAKQISSSNKSVAESIGRDWEDQDDLLSTAGKSVNSLESIKGSLGKARDTLLESYGDQFEKKKAQIAGNKELITKNQGTTLKDQAEALRKSIFNANLTLGGGNSSASGVAARALASSMGKNRQAVLTEAGDQISTENQNEVNASDEHQLMRKAAYDWEKRQSDELTSKFKVMDAALKRLKNKAPDWKKADIDKESESNLQNFLSGLSEINATARNYRDYLNQIITGKYGEAQAVDAAAINIDTPAALDTPEFDDKIVLPGNGTGEEVDPNSPDFYNPENKNKKRVNLDIFGNPLTFDEAMA